MAVTLAPGSGSSPSNDGTNLARRGDVVVVTINHRLNVLGFANFSEFSSDFAASGDVGMLDIVHALKWVCANIAQFGGDPNTVMIFGQSGGGRKVETLLAMPSAKGLFHRATIESGIAIKVVSRDIAIRNAEQLLAKLGIRKTDMHEIQKLPLERIMAAYFAVVREAGKVDQNVAGFAPTVDGRIPPASFPPNGVTGIAGNRQQGGAACTKSPGYLNLKYHPTQKCKLCVTDILPVTALMRNAHGVAEWKMFLRESTCRLVKSPVHNFIFCLA